MTATASLGESLDLFLSSSDGGTVTASPSVLKYTELQQRYEELGTKLSDKLKTTESSLSKAAGLKYALDNQCTCTCIMTSLSLSLCPLGHR